jgi:DNA-binding response OmpR family regulator
MPEAPRKHVLVVDDEADVRASVVELLAKVGCDVEAVGRGEDAVIAVQARRPDLMILDLGMPDLDGWSVIERLIPIGPPPIVLLASRADDPKSGPFQDFIVGYLYKPLHYGELAASCRRLLSERESTTEVLDRRQHRRRRLIVDLTLLTLDGAPRDGAAVVGKLVDLSPRGLQMETASALAIGDKVRVALHVPGGQLILDGKVQWRKPAESGFAYGLDLGHLTRDDARRLTAVLEP